MPVRPRIVRDPEATTASPGTPEEQALAVYAASNDYLERVMGAPQSFDPLEMSNYYSGDASVETTQIINGALQDSRYQALETTSHPIVETVGDTEIVLTDCFVEVSTDFDQATGEPRSSEGRHVINLRVWVRLIEVGWRVDGIEVQDAPCTP